MALAACEKEVSPLDDEEALSRRSAPAFADSTDVDSTAVDSTGGIRLLIDTAWADTLHYEYNSL